MNIREERVNNDLFLVIRLFWVEFFPRPMWRVQARVKGWYITCYLSEASLKKCFLSGIILSYWPGVNYIHGYMTRGADLKLSIYSSRSKRGHQTFIIYAKKWNWLFLQKSYKNFEMWSVQKTNWKKSFKKVVIGSKKRLKKKVWKKLWLVYVAVPLPVPGCQRLSGILQFIFVREHLPIVIFYFYLYLYFTFKVTHLAIVVADLCKYLSEFVLSCKSEFIGLCMFVFHIYFSFLFRESFANQSC